MSRFINLLDIVELYRWNTLRTNVFHNQIKRIQAEKMLRENVEGTYDTSMFVGEDGVMCNLARVILPFKENYFDLFCRYGKDIACVVWNSSLEQKTMQRYVSEYAHRGFEIGSLAKILKDSLSFSFLRFSLSDVYLVCQFWGHKDDVERIVSHLDSATSHPYKSHSELASFLRGELY